MKQSLLAVLVFLTTISFAQTVSIIPEPVSIQMNTGHFKLTKSTIILTNDLLKQGAELLNGYLKKIYGFQLPIKTMNHSASNETNCIALGEIKQDHQSDGFYRLTINNQQVTIEGKNQQAVSYGIQSFLQLMPITTSIQFPVLLPNLRIEDYPRFAYRGLHLDVGRHFYSVDFIKKYIDYMAMYKLNTFHWHLTEDQGWRIEIKKYPKLTQLGAYRDGTIMGRYPGTGNDSIRHGGFYTQEQIKEVVKYAAERYITIIPEIEMPGHSSAALAAYPELGCTGGPYKVQQTWGVFKEVYCAGNEKTFQFLQDVLDEVMELFPSKYIHIGGDECPKASWKTCPKCQQRIIDNHLKDEHELQSYFVQRMEKYINSKGRRMIGWDEILEGGLAANATVMSWRGEDGGIAAAKQGHDVIMTPGNWCYFDHSQIKNDDSVTIGGYLPINKVYAYEPIPASLSNQEAMHILGAQANVWTEYIGNEKKLEYMLFPRISALSEVLWSPKEKRNWLNFEPRLQNEFKRYDWLKINYSKAYFDKTNGIGN